MNALGIHFVLAISVFCPLSHVYGLRPSSLGPSARGCYKDAADVYIRRIIKDLSDKAFKHYVYIEYYNAVLDFVRRLKPKKTLNITFNKEFKILKEQLI